MNRDGFVDLIFEIKDSSSVFIVYNKGVLPYEWSKDYCETHSKDEKEALFIDLSKATSSSSVRMVLICIGC